MALKESTYGQSMIFHLGDSVPLIEDQCTLTARFFLQAKNRIIMMQPVLTGTKLQK
jgi:hypothetical protein